MSTEATHDAGADAVSGEAVSTPETHVPAGNGFARDVWVNFKRWNLKAVRNPFVVVGSVVQPVIFLLLFSQVFGGVVEGALSGRGGAGGLDYITYLVPAIVIQVAIISAAASGIGLVNDMERGLYTKVLVSPMHRGAVFLGKTLSELFRIGIQVVIIMALGWLLGAEYAGGLASVPVIIAVAMLFSLWFTAFSNVVAIVTQNTESTIVMTNLLVFPLLFVSSAFLPTESMPGWLQTVADLNPITYGVDAVRTLVVEGWAWDSLLPAVAVLLVLDLVFGAVGVYFLNRATSAKAK
ncbi:ABC transporter permease [Haloarchaeobius sp. DFWS5]|uniref:ABC transporter permease n=1 Tax=Haloarchaeobius sp. DFWS5 TaxID=3446114 RepID=UPI003EBE813E